MDLKASLGPVSKAVAGALVGLLISALAQYNITLGDGQKDAIELLLNGGIAAIIGYLAVYFAPRNTGTK